MNKIIEIKIFFYCKDSNVHIRRVIVSWVTNAINCYVISDNIKQVSLPILNNTSVCQINMKVHYFLKNEFIIFSTKKCIQSRSSLSFNWLRSHFCKIWRM